MPSPPWITQLDPKACGLDGVDLLLRHQPDAPLQLLSDFLAVDAGRRDWATAARDFLHQSDFAAAAKCARRSDNQTIVDEIEAEYSARLKQTQQNLEELDRAAREVAKMAQDLPALTQAREYRDLAAESLAQLPHVRPGILTDLEALSKQCLVDFDEAYAEGQRQLGAARQEARSRQEKQKDLLRDLWAKFNRLSGDLLLDAAQPEQAQKLQFLTKRASEAVRERNHEKLSQVYDLLLRVSGGQELSDEEIGTTAGGSSDPALAPVFAVAGSATFSAMIQPAPTEFVGPRLRIVDLSDLVQQDLERTQGKGAAPSEGHAIEPRDFDRKAIEQQYAVAKPAAAKDAKAMSQYLLSWAKLNLLDRRYDRALTLFGDALRWLTQSESEKRSCDVAVWGLLLSLAIPYLPKEEQRRTLTASNLSALCERKIGHFPLLRIEQMGLISELAQHILRLGWPAAGHITRNSLLAYFGWRSVAAAEFAAEVAEAVTIRPSHALHLLALLYDDQLPDGQLGNLLRQLAGARPSLHDARSKHNFCVQLREILLPYADDWELVASVSLALQQQIKRLGQRESSGENKWKITHDLLSPDVTLVTDSRLVFRLKSEATTPLRGVSTVARLLNAPRIDATPFHGVLEPIEPLAQVEPGVTYERTIKIVRTDEELCTSLVLELQHSAHSEDGTDRLLEARTRYFTVRFVPPKEAAPPLNPYTFGLPIKNPNSIFGREDCINQICDALIGRDQDNAVLVLGDRKIGKTTLLMALREHRRIIDRYIPLSIDLEKLPDHCASTTFYYQYLVQPIQQKLRELGLPGVSCSEAALHRAPEQVFEEFFRQLDRMLQSQNQRLLLILDEFERVIALIERSSTGGSEARGLGPEVLAALRAVLQPARCISLIVSGVKYVLRRHTTHQNDRLARLGVEIELPPLDLNGAQLLVKLPPRGQYEVTPTAVDLILKETARQPYLIQKLCNQLYREMAHCDSRLASTADVQRILEAMARDAGGFVHLVEPIQSATDYRLIQALAMLQSGHSYVRLKDLLRQLRRESGKSDEGAVRSRITELADQIPSVVERHPISPYQFRLTVGLFARFLRQQPESHAPFYIPSKS